MSKQGESMSSRSISLLMCLLTFAGVTAHSQATYQYHASGDRIQADAYSPASNGSVFVSTGKVNTSFNGPQDSGYLAYSRTVLTPNGYVTYNGSGTIPKTALVGSANSKMSMSVDTSTIDGFVNQVCTTDPNTFETTCNPSTGGLVSVSCTRNTLISVHTSGTVQSGYNGMTFMTNGVSDGGSADCDLSVLTTDGHTQFGSVGFGSNTSLQITHKR